MRQAQTFDFNFKNVEKQFESYQGINVKLRYVGPRNFRFMDTLMRELQILYSSDDITANGRRSQREGYLGAFVPYATG